MKNIPSNVISDIESGRKTLQKGKWGQQQPGEKRCNLLKTHIKELDNKLCFTMRPVLSCAPGCSSNETKSKTYDFHCMERNPASLNLKKRIEKGANPDLSQKPVSMTKSLNIPLSCKA